MNNRVGVGGSEPDPVPARPFSLVARLHSFRHAGRGISYVLRNEHNAWIHVAAIIAVVAAGIVFHVSASDWRWLIVAISMVLAAEAINTAFERLCDLVSPGPNELVRVVKDVATGAVLVLAIGAALIGVLTFAPYLVIP